MWGGRAHRGRVPGFLHFPEKPPDIGRVCGGRGCPCTPNSGEGLFGVWEGPRGQPRGRAVPPGGFKRAGAKSCFVALATDVLHEGPEACGGDDRARRLAAGEGLPGGRHERLARALPASRASTSLCLEILGEPPYYSPGTFRVLCFGGAPVLAGGRFPAGGTRPFACQFEFPSSFCCMRRRELSRDARPVTARSRRRPHACS